MINTNQIQANLEKTAKATADLAEVNVKSFTKLATIQLDMIDNLVKATTENTQALTKVKNQKDFQGYVDSLKVQAEKEFNKSVENYLPNHLPSVLRRNTTSPDIYKRKIPPQISTNWRNLSLQTPTAENYLPRH